MVLRSELKSAANRMEQGFDSMDISIRTNRSLDISMRSTNTMTWSMRYSIVDEGGERQQHVESSKSVSWSTESPSVRLLQDNNNSDNCSPTSAKQQQRLLWYNKADLRRFREECEIAKIFSRKELGTNYTCHWGLEHVINEDNAIKRDNRRREAIDRLEDDYD